MLPVPVHGLSRPYNLFIRLLLSCSARTTCRSRTTTLMSHSRHAGPLRRSSATREHTGPLCPVLPVSLLCSLFGVTLNRFPAVRRSAPLSLFLFACCLAPAASPQRSPGSAGSLHLRSARQVLN
jgi:hypothetical protein